MHAFKLPYTELAFKFGTFKVLDYKDRIAELDANPNS
jgi:hypothetical protein